MARVWPFKHFLFPLSFYIFDAIQSIFGHFVCFDLFSYRVHVDEFLKIEKLLKKIIKRKLTKNSLMSITIIEEKIRDQSENKLVAP
jgi:hypothetical protein